jgi:uncharacterized protein (TIGR03435 family)
MIVDGLFKEIRMMRSVFCAVLVVLLSNGAFGQPSSDAPKIEIADVHTSAKTLNAYIRTSPVRNGRYEIRTASVLDLVRLAYGFDADKILGGPNWLELDRFDITAKVPANTTVDSQKEMLQALLADRFKLVVHKETKPLPTYVLTAGKSPKLKEADGSGDTGCKMETASGPPVPGSNVLRMLGPDGRETAISIGPGMMLHYSCRNMTMAAFAAGLRGMMGASLGTNPVLDETGLKGNWNFDVKWSLSLIGPAIGENAERVTASDALDKQLGLKLEQRPNPTPVLVVDSVSRVPTENPPGVAEALPASASPKEFEVADVKLANPNPDPRTSPMRFQMQPGGRLNVQAMPMRFLISRAFNDYGPDQLLNLPKWVDTERFDIIALAPANSTIGPGLDPVALEPLMRSLLEDRFKLTYHMEERPVSEYSLGAAKPKMKKADPDSRIHCRTGPAVAGAPPGSMMLTCQIVTMALFAERLRGLAPGINTPVLDATGIEGGWDFTLTFSQLRPNLLAAPRPAESGQPGVAPLASDPAGGFTIFEAIEKQLGLKLEMQKRQMLVVVFDHLEQKPTDN